jgi:beta-aspartyl-peptidase (threonine type)
MQTLQCGILAVTAWVVLAGIAVAQPAARHWSIQVHAGAGDIARSTTSAEREAAYRSKITEAIQAGAAVLDKGGSSLDAVEATIRILEDASLFDVGRGAVFNSAGQIELDAAIMDGSNLKAGAVAAVMHTRHPISAARAVMEKSPHVMIAGPGADAFAAEVGLEQVEQSFFFSERRWQALVRELKREGRPIPARPAGAPPAPAEPVAGLFPEQERWFGTVGVVALDRSGNLAAGTSTGGLQAKHPGRVGDSPIIGAGTYASNASCAVSGTGVGEYFIRLGVAREICNLVQFRGMKAQQAADEVIHKELETLKGVGGVIVMTTDGQAAWSFNTPGMFRARLSEGGALKVALYADEQ